MQRTRITVSLLVGVAVTALSGCVSVQPRPDVPPRPRASGPTQDLTPQIVLPPVHDSLEAAPAPGPSGSARRPSNGAPPPETRRTAPRVQRQPRYPNAARPRPHRALPAVTAPAPAPQAPVAGTDVCALGRGYGHWPAGSPQSRICDDTYGR
ncbi:hypothetical protein [Streptomyces sp. NBC_01363]|uniref:hypothetical protein n=1 Tax=Streptomyces sp. NBC_01363 TaxID=2903840 RepID=UPI00224EB4C9|nr:hypothetical protein [Streptomyces sp. NBC_01363]MCX4733513.1 hypothetical protein [Streptomyces sp. NBC_01363]